jgi:hypothetical protein
MINVMKSGIKNILVVVVLWPRLTSRKRKGTVWGKEENPKAKSNPRQCIF